MNKWFEVVIKAEVNNPDGGKHPKKNVTERYMFDGVSFTEVEARAVDELKPFFDNFLISNIKPMRISELFRSVEDTDLIFKMKVNFITINEKKGKEIKQAAYMYVEANDTKDAEARLKEGMKGTMADWKLESVAETKIMDIFPYDYKAKSEKIIDNKAVDDVAKDS